MTLLEATKDLFLLAHRLKVDLLPFYIPGRYNTIAGSLSREESSRLASQQGLKEDNIKEIKSLSLEVWKVRAGAD